jgi:hypothetical protein
MAINQESCFFRESCDFCFPNKARNTPMKGYLIINKSCLEEYLIINSLTKSTKSDILYYVIINFM